MKPKYKFLIDLCNSYVAPLDHNGDFDFMWWTSSTGYAFETPKSEFVETMIDLLSKKDKNFPKREFLKQVKCSYRHGLVDIGYKKQHEAERKKQEREERKAERKAEKEKEKMLNDLDYYYDDYYGDVV